MTEHVLERFKRYVRIDTQSKEDVEAVPSTERQFDLARLLVDELRAIGLADAHVDEHCYVYATLPATRGLGKAPTVGLIAHLDTSPEAPGAANPMVWKAYDGGDIHLPKGEVEISPGENPELKRYVGHDIVTSDGSSLLGADDKAGVAEIMAALQRIVEDDVPHGRVRIAFTPDEEVAKGTSFFDLKGFGADFAYTIDGGEVGQIEAENFNAAAAIFTIKGYNVHPGYAKDKMVNSMRALAYLVTLLPEDMAPETTEDREGYLHPHHVGGSVDESVAKVLIRDFTEEGMEAKRRLLRSVREQVAARYSKCDVRLEIKDSYRNMKVVLDAHPRVLEIALAACRNAGVEPTPHIIRGGTDGARLCYDGLPTPNVFAGGVNFHGVKEFIPVSSMERAVDVIVEIVRLSAGPTHEGRLTASR
ncbi:MAG: peptidase T [Thermoplasmata archaeon]|nr:peptidase T [Thermoplasmata archaeon]